MQLLYSALGSFLAQLVEEVLPIDPLVVLFIAGVLALIWGAYRTFRHQEKREHAKGASPHTYVDMKSDNLTVEYEETNTGTNVVIRTKNKTS